jgi:hypothetical protein
MTLTDFEMALGTLAAGAVLSLGSARFQHWRDRVAAKNDREEARNNALLDEQRAREGEAAKLLLRCQSDIRMVLRGNRTDVRPVELGPLAEEIDILSAYIDDDALRDRLEYLSGFIWWCEDVGPRVGKDPRDVTWMATNEVGWIASSLLRGRTHPEPDWYQSWAAAWDAAEADALRDQEATIAAAEHQRGLDSNPDNYR